MAQAPVLPRGFELPLEPRLPRIGSVDAVALEERAASLAKRSIKRDAKVFALELAVRMMDLTTLEGQDTPGKVAALASKAIRPDPSDSGIPSVAAICVYPNLVPSAVARVEGTSVKVASVAGMVIGSEVRFGYPNEAEVRELTFVGTTGAGGTGVSFTMPLAFGHRSGDAVIVQVDAGGSTFASNSGVTRRLPSSVYHKWELVVPGLDGRSIRFRLSDAIMIDSASFEAKDDGTLAPRLKLQSRWDPAAPTVSPWMITRVPGV
jgi:hypothetical protein